MNKTYPIRQFVVGTILYEKNGEIFAHVVDAVHEEWTVGFREGGSSSVYIVDRDVPEGRAEFLDTVLTSGFDGINEPDVSVDQIDVTTVTVGPFLFDEVGRLQFRIIRRNPAVLK